MADALSNLPLVVARDFNVLVSKSDQGAVIRRTRFPRPPIRRFKLTADNLEMTTELAALLLGLDAALGSALSFNVTLPIVGTVTVRNDDDVWSYAVRNGTLRDFAITLIEEPRIA